MLALDLQGYMPRTADPVSQLRFENWSGVPPVYRIYIAGRRKISGFKYVAHSRQESGGRHAVPHRVINATRQRDHWTHYGDAIFGNDAVPHPPDPQRARCVEEQRYSEIHLRNT